MSGHITYGHIRNDRFSLSKMRHIYNRNVINFREVCLIQKKEKER